MKSSVLRLLASFLITIVATTGAYAAITINTLDGNGVEPTAPAAGDGTDIVFSVSRSGQPGTAEIEASGPATLSVDFDVTGAGVSVVGPDVFVAEDHIHVDLSGSNSLRSLTVEPLHDNLPEGIENFTLTIVQGATNSPGSPAAQTRGIEDPAGALPALVVSNDPAGSMGVSPKTTSSDGVLEATFYVQLATEPSGSVDVDVSVGAPAEGDLTDSDESDEDSVTLNFTVGNWDTGQLVTITGQDSGAGTNQIYSITVGPASGGGYGGVDNVQFDVTNTYDNDPGTIQFTSGAVLFRDEGQTAILPVERVGGTDGLVGVTYTITPVSAMGSDFSEVSSSPLSWADTVGGNMNIEIDITDDMLNEDVETFDVTLSAVTGGAAIGSNTSRTVSINVDPADDTTFTITSDGDVDEDADENASFTITRSGGTPTESIDVSYNVVDGSATTPDDYDGDTDALSDTLTFLTSETSKQITINVIDDSDEEGLEDFSASISSAASRVNTSGPASVNILASDASGTAGIIDITPATVDVDEDAGTADFMVTRSGGTDGEVTFDYTTVDGTATDENTDDDYTETTGTNETFAADSATPIMISVPITDDGESEGLESFTVVLSDVTGGATEGNLVGTVNITDNDSAGTLAIDPAAYSDDEGNTVMVMVTRTGGSSGVVTVDYSTVDGTATDENTDNDYGSEAGTLSWLNGDSDPQAISVMLVDDGDNLELAENFTVELSGETGGATLGNDTGTVTINAAGASPGQLSISPATYDVNENGGMVNITVTRTGGTDGNVSIDWQTNDVGSADPVDDFVAANNTLMWADGDAAPKQISVTIVDDGDTEADETFTVTIDDASIVSDAPGVIVNNDTGTVTIIDDDPSLEGTPAINDAVVAESVGMVSLAVSRAGGTDGPISFDWMTIDDTAVSGGDPLAGEDDYDAAAGSFSWADGENDVKQIDIVINEDDVGEPSEDFTVELEVTIGAEGEPFTLTATVTINDNDQGGALTINDRFVYEGETEDGPVFLQVKRIINTVGPASVEYESVDGTAVEPDDYQAVMDILSWADGEGCLVVDGEEVCNNGIRYIPIFVELDDLREGIEDFTVELFNESGNDGTAASITVLKREGLVQISDVVPVPTLGQWALMLMAGLMLLVGGRRLRARRVVAR